MKKHKKNTKKTLTVLACGVLAATAFGLVGCSNKDLSSGKIYKGTDYSIATNAENGDFFIDTDDYKLYQKIDGSWELIKENYGKEDIATIVDYSFVGYKPAYLLNEDFSLSNTKLRLFMSDNTYQDVPLTTDMLSQAPDMSIAGTKSIKIQYKNEEYTYEIEVKDSYSPTTSYAMSVLNTAKSTLSSASNLTIKTISDGIEETYIINNNELFVRKSNGVNNLQSTWLIQGNENTEKYLIEDSSYTYSMNDTTLSSSSAQEYVDSNTSSVLSENIEESKIASVEYSEGIVTIVYEKSSTEIIKYIIEDGNIIEVVKNGVAYNYSYNENSLDVPEIPVSTWNLSTEDVEEYLQESIAYSQNSINKLKKVYLYKGKDYEDYSKYTTYIYDSGNARYQDNSERTDTYYIVEGDYVWEVLQDTTSTITSVATYSITDNKYARRETQPLGIAKNFKEVAIRNCNTLNSYDVQSFSGTMTNDVIKSMEITMKYQESDTDAIRTWDYVYTYKIEDGLVRTCACVSFYKGSPSTHSIYNYYYNEEFDDEIPTLNINLFPELTAEEYLSNALSNLKIASKIKAELIDSSEIVGTILMDANENAMYSTSTNENVSEKWTIKEDDAWTGYWINTSDEEPSYHKYADSDSEGVTIYDKFLSLNGFNVLLHLNDEHLGESSAVYKLDGKVYIETMGGWTLTIENGWIVSATDRIQTIQFTYGDNNIDDTIPTLPSYDWQ